MIAPVLKGKLSLGLEQRVLTRRAPVVQIMISQAIIAYRTWNITRRSKEMGLFLVVFGSIVTVLEWYSNVDARIPVQSQVSVYRNPPAAISITNRGHFYIQGK